MPREFDILSITRRAGNPAQITGRWIDVTRTSVTVMVNGIRTVSSIATVAASRQAPSYTIQSSGRTNDVRVKVEQLYLPPPEERL